jgi:hypothetical protein
MLTSGPSSPPRALRVELTSSVPSPLPWAHETPQTGVGNYQRFMVLQCEMRCRSEGSLYTWNYLDRFSYHGSLSLVFPISTICA